MVPRVSNMRLMYYASFPGKYAILQASAYFKCLGISITLTRQYWHLRQDRSQAAHRKDGSQ